MTKLLTTLLLLLCNIICTAQDDIKCSKLKRSDFPAKDLPPKNFNKESFKGKYASDYYYGLNVPKDYRIARYLAFTEMRDTFQDLPLEGASVLLMLYANGFGVKPDFDLCIRLACANVGFAEAEIEGRIKHLNAMKTGEDKSVFDFCDDVTSGYVSGFCQGIVSERNKIRRKEKLKKLFENWSAKEVAAYKELRKSTDAFFDAKGIGEVDMSGTPRAAIAMQEEDELEDGFLKKLELANSCSLKVCTDADFIAVDKKLNAVYQKVMKNEDNNEIEGTVKRTGVKDTQRAWLIYRDAWVTFGKIKCPRISADTWKTMLTKERIAQLQELDYY